jgi:hypothetical protein
MEEKKKEEIKDKIKKIFKLKQSKVTYYNFDSTFIDHCLHGLIMGGLTSSVCLLFCFILALFSHVSISYVLGLTIGIFVGNFVFGFFAED